MQAYTDGDIRSLSAAELLQGQGSSLVVFHPGARYARVPAAGSPGEGSRAPSFSTITANRNAVDDNNS